MRPGGPPGGLPPPMLPLPPPLIPPPQAPLLLVGQAEAKASERLGQGITLYERAFIVSTWVAQVRGAIRELGQGLSAYTLYSTVYNRLSSPVRQECQQNAKINWP
jgi:hypothetical protein